jgi:hypothetical protein
MMFLYFFPLCFSYNQLRCLFFLILTRSSLTGLLEPDACFLLTCLSVSLGCLCMSAPCSGPLDDSHCLLYQVHFPDLHGPAQGSLPDHGRASPQLEPGSHSILLGPHFPWMREHTHTHTHRCEIF